MKERVQMKNTRPGKNTGREKNTGSGIAGQDISSSSYMVIFEKEKKV